MANGVSGTKGAGGNTQPMQQAAQNTAPVQEANTAQQATVNASTNTVTNITGKSLVDKIMSASHDARLGIYALRSNWEDSVTDRKELAKSIDKTLKKANTAEGFTRNEYAIATVRSNILKAVGKEYEFIEKTKTTPGNWFTSFLPVTEKVYYLKKKS